MGKPGSHPNTKRKKTAQYISRTQAVRKLQISLKDFRRLCILKGIHPRDPPRKKAKAGNRTYYFTKDILFLAHEPVLGKFRDFKSFLKRYAKALGKGDKVAQKRLKANRPTYQLDHIVKERYPTFEDALGDLDDALTLVHAYAALPQSGQVASHKTRTCRRLVREFNSFVIHSKSLRKVFVSIKGVYYRANVNGKDITWLVPHNFTQQTSKEVDFQVMGSFLEFYQVLLHFVNLRLYREAGLAYPPQLDSKAAQEGVGVGAVQMLTKEQLASAHGKPTKAHQAANDEPLTDEIRAQMESLQNSIDSIAARDRQNQAEEDTETAKGAQDQEAEADAEVFGMNLDDTDDQHSKVFEGCIFFLAREVPREPLEFVVRAGGGKVGWEGDASPYEHSSDQITHEVVDRPSQKHVFLSRDYCQPQWVFDSFNFETLLPIEEYAPGVPPPAHLSPFVDDENEGYVPDRAKALRRIVAAARGEEIAEESGEESGEEGDKPPTAVEAQEESEDDVEEAEDDDEDDEEEDDEDEDEGEDGDEVPEMNQNSEDESSDGEDQASEDDEERGHRAAMAAEERQRELNMTPAEQQYRSELKAEKKGKGFVANKSNGSSAAVAKRKAQQEAEERQMAINMMPKKKRRLYERALHGKQQKQKAANALMKKAKESKGAKGAKKARPTA